MVDNNISYKWIEIFKFISKEPQYRVKLFFALFKKR